MRRRVLDRLAAYGETTATALAAELPVSRQAVMQHLAVLQHVELVASHRAGRERRYTVQPQQLTATARWMTQPAAQWDARLPPSDSWPSHRRRHKTCTPQPTDEHPPAKTPTRGQLVNQEDLPLLGAHRSACTHVALPVRCTLGSGYSAVKCRTSAVEG